MAELTPIPLVALARRMRREIEERGSAFDLPVRKWWVPGGTLDFGVSHFGRRAATPVGPAAGPHTQLAQNIVLSWLAGGRIIELKTVQVNDRLEIPRPCIHAPNVGFNVEWSQELRVEESLREYAKALYLIEILKTTRGFGVFGEAPTGSFDTVFDISVGYDLDGIRSDKVAGFLGAMRVPGPVFDDLRQELANAGRDGDPDLNRWSEIELPAEISGCVTLSTFHGCPADQVESIARHLIEDHGLDTIIKLNPTLLGFDAVRELLVERLGYRQLVLRQEAFDADLQYDDGLEMLRRLRGVAAECGTEIGAKFTNTLVVENEPGLFPTQADPYMYLSGAPLHVISMNLMQRFREDAGFEFPVSFSAGIHAGNFADAVACGMVPVTTCTDLLKQGGYGRLPRYLSALTRAMDAVGVTSREVFVLAARGHGAAAIEEALGGARGVTGVKLAAASAERRDDSATELRAVLRSAGLGDMEIEAIVLRATRVAGRLNGRELVEALVDDPKYAASANERGPRRLERELALYDCVNCDLCIAACPNDAIFAYEVEPVEGVMRESHQLAVVEGLCNECSNCEVYCPENGAPFLVKERVFLDVAAFETSDLDGFCRDGDSLRGRVAGVDYRIAADPASETGAMPGDRELAADAETIRRMNTVWASIFASPTPNAVNPDPATDWKPTPESGPAPGQREDQ